MASNASTIASLSVVRFNRYKLPNPCVSSPLVASALARVMRSGPHRSRVAFFFESWQLRIVAELDMEGLFYGSMFGSAYALGARPIEQHLTDVEDF